MSTISTGSERRPHLGMRVWLALAFGTLAGVLCVVLSFAIGERASDVARSQTGRYLARMAIEYGGKLDEARDSGSRARAQQLRATIEASADPAVPVELLLIGRDGAVLVGPRELEGTKLAVPAAQAAIQRWPDGERYLVASATSTAGSIVARTRADVVFAPVAELRRAILWAGLILALAGIAAGWVLATRHARPLEALTRAAQEIASGNDRTELPPLDDNQEVARLAEALRAMLSRLRSQAESLRDAQDRLQRRVHERTAELVKVQAELQLEVADAKLARDDLARAHGQLALALEASGLALWDYDADTDSVFLSAGWSRMRGGPAVESHVSFEALIELVPARERERVLAALRAAMEGKTPDFRLDHPITRRDGTLLWVASHGRVVERDPDGRPKRFIGTVRETIEWHLQELEGEHG